jgi:hypothetical protein
MPTPVMAEGPRLVMAVEPETPVPDFFFKRPRCFASLVEGRVIGDPSADWDARPVVVTWKSTIETQR